MIGSFGKMVFETSDKRIMTFNRFNRTVKGRWVEHNLYKRTPRSEFVGSDLDEITFTVILNSSLGVDPLTQINKWEDMVSKGYHDILVIGNKQIGKNHVKVTSITEAWNVIYNNGAVSSANIDVTISEYVDGSKHKETESATVFKKSVSYQNSKHEIGDTYQVVTTLTGYYTAVEAKNGKSSGNPTGRVNKGKYYVFNYHAKTGMINVTKVKGVPGSWINPKKNV